MTIMSGGTLIDKVRGEIKSRLRAVESVENALIEAGCLNARIHWKVGRTPGVKDVMFMFEPTDSDGKRPYHHVGKDPQRQAEAKAKVAREAARAQLERQREELQQALANAEHQLSLLEHTFKGLRREAQELEQLSNDKRTTGNSE